jgi:hypothetical protein
VETSRIRCRMTASAGNMPGGVSPDGAAARRQFPLTRWFRALRPREVLIFVSSPQDCAAERDAVRRVVAWLSDQPEVARQRVRFRALLWEDLPPGVAEDGDFQKRIDTLMRRFGYDAYGIYLGIMKGRLGTPTPRYRSGTIEELETSLKSHQRSGLPSEVLFYFLVPDAEQVTEVREFRSELERRGFLSAGVTADQFQDRLTDNLLEIASSWNSWTNVLRRTWRRFGIGIVAAVSLVAVSVIGADLGSRWQIGQALDRGDIAGAAQLWRGWSLLMPLSGSGVRRRINERAAGSIGAEPSLERQLNLLADWRRDPAFLPAAFALSVAVRNGSAAAASKLGPSTFTAKISRIRSAVASIRGRMAPAPALFTSTSKRPPMSTAFATVRTASSGSAVSATFPTLTSCGIWDQGGEF